MPGTTETADVLVVLGSRHVAICCHPPNACLTNVDSTAPIAAITAACRAAAGLDEDGCISSGRVAGSRDALDGLLPGGLAASGLMGSTRLATISLSGNCLSSISGGGAADAALPAPSWQGHLPGDSGADLIPTGNGFANDGACCGAAALQSWALERAGVPLIEVELGTQPPAFFASDAFREDLREKLAEAGLHELWGAADPVAVGGGAELWGTADPVPEEGRVELRDMFAAAPQGTEVPLQDMPLEGLLDGLQGDDLGTGASTLPPQSGIAQLLAPLPRPAPAAAVRPELAAPAAAAEGGKQEVPFTCRQWGDVEVPLVPGAVESAQGWQWPGVAEQGSPWTSAIDWHSPLP